MENINIKINKKTRQVNLTKSVIGNDGENLQEKLIFQFDEFVNGTARLELLKQGETASYIMLTKVNETYELPIKSVITKAGRLNMQLVITEGINDEEIPVFKSNQFYMIVNSSINAEIEEEEEYPQWIDVANTKLNEIDSAIEEASNLNIEVSKSGTTTTLTLTDKDGETSSVSILDGAKGDTGSAGSDGITPTIGNNGNWYLGETDTGKPSRGIQGETGQAGSDGADGISPTVTTSKSGTTTTITITDKNGDHTATINDGIDGTNGQDGRDGYVQYTAGDNITIENNVISALGGSGVVVGDLKDNHTEARKFNFDEHEAGIYIDSSLGTNLYMALTTGSGTYTRFRYDRLLWLNYFDSTITSDPFAIALMINSDSYELSIQKFSKAQDGRLTVTKANLGYYSSYLVTASPQSFSGTKTFMTTPKLYSYTAPTYDEEIVAKKYVDDSISSAITTTLNGQY